MKKHFFLLSLLLSLTLGIGQMWGAINVNSTWTATAFGSIPEGSTVIIINANGKAISNATVTKAPAKIEAAYNSTTKKISVSTSGKTLDDIAWTTENGTNGTKFWVYGSTTNLLGLSKLNDNNAVAVNVATTAIYSEFVMGANGNLLEAMNGSSRGGRFVGEYISGSDWRSYNSETANNYKSGSSVPALTFYVLDAGDPPAPTSCDTPTFDPEAGEFSTNSIDVAIATTTDGATIYYTLDGNTPTTSSSVYSNAISLTETTTVKAIAVKDGLSNSEMATATYTKVAPFAGSVLEITKTDFTTVSYDDNAGDHVKDGVTFTTAKVYQSGSSIQFQKTYGLLYNKTDLGEIAKIEITTYTGKANNLVVYAGTSENPSSTTVTGSASGAVTTYTFASGNGYFAIKCNSTGASNVDPIKIYYTGTVTVKQAAGLAYAEADQKKLTKLGETFTAPTLTNPNGLTVSYESDNTEVATVNPTTGAVSIVAAGKAVITASFAGDDTYNAGSASYTIGVTSHAGTELDPFDAADAKLVIDVVGTKESAYVAGVVSSIQTTTLPAEGYITFFISADGATTGQQIEAYKCKSLNGEAFSALSDVVTGATVVITGTLKKYNSTYEFDQNCHLVSYEAPATSKQSIANDQANPYTVAQAITYAADGVTYDLDDYVYVQGVVYDVKSFNNGAMNIFIKDANAENQFELFKCAGINDGSATTPFEALTDVQEGDVVIGYGQLTVYNNVYEFKQGNYLVDLDRPAVAVSSVELASTATVKVGNTINLSASVLPANATDKVIEWSIQSGNDNITLNNGTVTGVAEGTAVVRATSHADNTKYAQCTITIAAADPVYAYYNYEKVTATAGIEDGEYLIVYEGDATHASVAFDGSLATLDAANNNKAVEIEDNVILGTNELHAATFTIGVTAGTLQSASGKYIGVTSNSNGLKTSDAADTYSHNFSIDNDGNAVIAPSFSGSTMALRYNYGSNDLRFRYYGASSQRAIALYKKVGTNEAPKANPQLAWDPADDIEITVGDAFTAPTLTYAQGFNGVDDIVIESNNTNLATVNAGVVSLVADATGEATITATFEGNDDYKPATVSYNITVSAAVVPPTPAVSGNVVIIAEYDSKFYAMTNSLASGALAGVEVEKDGSNIVVASAEDKDAIQWTATVTGENTTFQDGEGKYLAHTGTGTNLMLADEAENWTFDSENGCYSAVSGRAFFYYNTNGVFKNYSISSNLGKAESGYSGAPEVIEIDPENIVITSKADPELAYSPESDEITVGDAWSAPSLIYATGFDGLAAITYASNNEAVATVSDAGVIALAGGTGTATITATFVGNASYIAGSATYTVQVNAVVIPDHCDGTDDFATIDKTVSPTGYTSRATTEGWGAVNVGFKDIDGYTYLTLNGKTSAVGSILSPTLSDGIASLKIRYANTFSESNGVSFQVDIKQGENVVKTYTITKANSEVTQNTVYTEEIENINVSGEFQILITNLSPSNNTGNKDRLSIGRLCWTNYEEPAQTYTVTYDLNGGEGTAPTQDAVEEGTVITLADATGITAPENKEFDGWLCDIDQLTYAAGAEYTMTAANTTFTAQWKDATVQPLNWEEVRNGLTAGNYYTMCLDKAVLHIQGASIWKVLSKAQNGTDIILEEVGALPLEAGRPYLFYASADKLEVVYTGDAVEAPVNDDANNGLVGSFTKEEIEITTNYDNYILYNNQLYYVNSLAYVGANRAYLDMTQVPDYSAANPAPGRRRVTMHTNGTQVATGMDEVNVYSETAVKMLMDGQLFILRGEKMYDTTGRLVK